MQATLASPFILGHGLADASALPVPLPLVLVVAGGSVLGLVAHRSSSKSKSAVAVSQGVAQGGHGQGAGGGGAVSQGVDQGRHGQSAGGGGALSQGAGGALSQGPGHDEEGPRGHREEARAGTSADHRDQPSSPGSAGWLLPAVLCRLIDSGSLRVSLRALGVAGALVVLFLAAAGPVDGRANPAPRLMLVVVWAGIVPLSLVAPGMWRALNPLRAVSALIALVTADTRERGARPLPPRIGWWPGAVALAAFVAMEVAFPADPTALLVFLVLYGLVQVGAATVYGSRWYAHGEALEVLAQVVGRLSPIGRNEEGRLVLSSPLHRMGAPVPPGAVAVFAVLVGASLADFASELPIWKEIASGIGEPVASLALLAAAVGATATMATAGGRVRALAPALLPVITGYLFAHYFAVLLIEGQAALSQVGTLVTSGMDALAASQIVVRYEILPGEIAATVQFLGFLLPHLLAALLAVDLAFARYAPPRARAALAPMQAFLAVSAVAGTALRYGAG